MKSTEQKKLIADWIKANLSSFPDRFSHPSNGDGTQWRRWVRRAKETIDGITYRVYEVPVCSKIFPERYVLVSEDDSKITWHSGKELQELGFPIEDDSGWYKTYAEMQRIIIDRLYS